METLFTYFIKVSVLVSLFYLSYHFLLKKETFFGKNRLFLLLGLATSVFLPLVTITKTVWIEPEPVVFEEPFIIPNFSDDAVINTVSEEQKTEINWSLILAGFYVLGMLFFLVKFVLSSLSLYKILHKSPISKQNGFRFVDSKNVETPFSFFNYIAFDSTSFSEEELQNIITHEKVHCTQKHSFDVILSEIFSIVFWLNPFVWLYKKAIHQNLEFIADNKAIKTSENKKGYQKTLLKVTLNPKELALANSFFQPFIKKRIMMLNKNKSRKINLLKYALILPVLTTFVLLFQTKVVAQEKENISSEKNNSESSEQYKLPTSVDWKYADNSLVMQDTTVWVKDFAKNPDEYVNQSTGEKVVVKGGSWKDVEDHLKPKSENSLGKNPLIIINGKEISKEEFKKLNIEYLEFDGGITATTYTKEEAIEKFGEKGKDGAIVIKGELTNFNLKASIESSDEKDLLSFLKSAKDYSEIEIYNRYGALVYTLKLNEKIDAEKLKSLKSGTYFYVQKSDTEKSKSGYVFVENSTTKTEKEQEKNSNDKWGVSYKVNSTNDVKSDLLSDKDVDYKKALIILNDKESTSKELEELTKNIRSVSKMKSNDYLIKTYGEKAKNGVIIIETEDYPSQQYKTEEKNRAKDYKLLNGKNEGFIIHKNSKESDIELYASELKKIGIQMKVSNIKRNKAGEIIKIKISLSESSGDKNNKKETKAESTIEYNNQTIPDIYVGKRNGELVIDSK